MNRNLLGLLGLIVGAGVVSTPVKAQDARDFILVNRTQWTITGVYFSSPEDPMWRAARGDMHLAPSEQVKITFDKVGPCLVQIRVDYNNTYTSWPSGFNLCTNAELQLEPNSDGSLSMRYNK
jgi:hypothetical protein